MLSVALATLATDQKRSNGCYNCTGQAGLYQPAVKMVKSICSMQIRYSDVVFCVVTLHSISIFWLKFSHSSRLHFLYIDSEKVYTLIKHSVTKFSVLSSVQFTLSFIITFFEGMFSQRRNFNENNMILWYYQIQPKVVCKVHGEWIDGYDSQNKDKTLPLRKKSVS